MSYQVLARKWRPSTFDQMVGQDHVLKALVNALDNDRLHHAYLFTGTRGVGKTSIARLFAKSLNCEQGVGSSPCGQCSPCREISEGRFVDLIEVDAASRTRVEDTRELLENVQYAPTQGRYKVYLIDEVHMLSAHSFNALLKTLEEPPPHIKFLLATTDPQKLPVTILSRCLQFNLKNMTAERIVAHLQQVLAAEQIGFDDPALWLLARAADGSMRDAMSLTDQAISFGDGQLQEDDVRAMLGSVDQQQVMRLLQQLAEGSAQGVMDTVATVAEYGADFDDVLAELLGLLHRVAIAQALPASVDNSLGDQQSLLALASAMKAEDVQLFYQIALNGRKDLPLVPVPRDGFEMTLLRMLAFRPVMPGEVAVATSVSPASVSENGTSTVPPAQSRAEPPQTQSPALQKSAQPGTPVTEGFVPPEAPASVASPAVAPAASAEAAGEARMRVSALVSASSAAPAVGGAPQPEFTPPHRSAPEADPISSTPAFDDAPPWGDSAAAESQPAVEPAGESPPLKKAETPGAAATAAPSGGAAVKAAGEAAGETAEVVISEEVAAVSLENLDAQRWIPLLDAIGLSGMTYNIAANAVVEKVEFTPDQNARVHFLISARQMHLFNPTHQQRIEDALSRHFASSVKIAFSEGESAEESPARFRERRRKERLAAAVAAMQGDAGVQAIIERFGGRLDIESIRPVEC